MKELLMRSPFPGMDPFLEAPDIWPDVHTRADQSVCASELTEESEVPTLLSPLSSA
jgi:hypothetical protein